MRLRPRAGGLAVAEGFRTTRICTCDERKRLQAIFRFTFDPERNGWVFPEDPRRSMSASAKYNALVERSQFGFRDMSGEPYTYVECPFCFLQLPFVKLEPEAHPHLSDDGPQ